MNKKEGKEKKVETISMLLEHFFLPQVPVSDPQHTNMTLSKNKSDIGHVFKSE